jgi:hypothetical protein
MNNILSETPDQIQPPNPKLTVALPLQIPVGEILQETAALANIIISPIKQAVESNIASSVASKQESLSNALASSVASKQESLSNALPSNVSDGLYKGIYDTNPNVKTPYVGLYDTNPNVKTPYFGFYDTNRYRNNDYSQSMNTVTYSSGYSSNGITHLFLVVIAIYIALRRNGRFSFIPVFVAFCCPHIYILYAFYNGFCTIP